MKAGKTNAGVLKSTTTGQGTPNALAPGHGENIEQRTGIKNSYDTGTKIKTDAGVKSSTDANGNPD